jgi:Raf kinase inhibitor-like YbhB/YbcL family protein
MKLTSTAWADGQAIPAKFTCSGADVSPPLAWSDVPAGMQSLALICDDPDAPGGTWVHWVLYALPAVATALPENIAATGTLPDGSRQGLNDFRRVGYGGPCPPPGAPHHYVFKLYALDAVLSLNPRATKAELLRAMEGHVLAEARMTGIYQRPR